MYTNWNEIRRKKLYSFLIMDFIKDKEIWYISIKQKVALSSATFCNLCYLSILFG